MVTPTAFASTTVATILRANVNRFSTLMIGMTVKQM
jgi:hypothetical protein